MPPYREIHSADNKSEKIEQPIPFSELIGRPLRACIDAQDYAARSTMHFIESVGMQTSESIDAVQEAVQVSFSYRKEGRMVHLRVPLLTIVPIPYFSIDSLEIKFRANIKGVQEEKMQKEAQKNSPSSMLLQATYARSYSSSEISNSSNNFEQAIDVCVRATQDHMPSGLAKVMNFLGDSIVAESETITLSDKAFRELFNNGIQYINNPTLSMHSGSSLTPYIPTDLPKINRKALSENMLRSEVAKVQTINISHNEFPFRSIDDLGYFHALRSFQCRNITLPHVRTFNLGYLSNVRIIELIGNNSPLLKGQYKPLMDFAWLGRVQYLSLENWGKGMLPSINLTSSHSLQELFIKKSHHRQVDISQCKSLQKLIIEASNVEELVVWAGFNRTQFNIPKEIRVIERRITYA